MAYIPSPADRDIPVERVLPDCCNSGVIFRALFLANAAVLLTCLAHEPVPRNGMAAFFALTPILEPAILASLLVLCGVRRIITTLRPWVQRLGAALIPAAITSLILTLFPWADMPGGSADPSSVVRGIAGAGVLGLLLQYYFELRARAFSPALSEARLQALQARIQPHFLFNSLNAVLSLIRTQPRAAEAALEDLADLFRALIREGRPLGSLDEEIGLCRKYLAIEQIRLGERLRVEWQLDEVEDGTLGRIMIPALLLQPLVENAVRHGVERRTDATPVRIVVQRVRDHVEIIVANATTKAAREPGRHVGHGMALDNIRERLMLLYDVEASLNTQQKDGTFEVRLLLPWREHA